MKRDWSKVPEENPSEQTRMYALYLDNGENYDTAARQALWERIVPVLEAAQAVCDLDATAQSRYQARFYLEEALAGLRGEGEKEPCPGCTFRYEVGSGEPWPEHTCENPPLTPVEALDGLARAYRHVVGLDGAYNPALRAAERVLGGFKKEAPATPGGGV